MANTYFVTCCLDSVRRRISRRQFLWLAPKSARRKDPNVSRSQSLSSTKIWRTIGRLLRTERSHSPCSGPFVLLGPSGPLRNGLCAVCKLQKLLISYPPGQAHNQCAIDACMLCPFEVPLLVVSLTHIGRCHMLRLGSGLGCSRIMLYALCLR